MAETNTILPSYYPPNKKKNIQFHCNPGKFKNIIIISIKIITVNVF